MFVQTKLMTIGELIKSIIDSSKERIKTPIVGAFIYSFLVYNWRPIFTLLFSDRSLEERIESVNSYFEYWYGLFVFGVPIIMAFVYTFGIPMLMLWIDKKLRPTKEKRITGIYDSKSFVTKKKILLAGEELILKDVESGKKEKQDFLDEIKSLKEIIKQKDESNNNIAISTKNTIDQLNQNSKSLNTLLEDMERREKDKDLMILSLENDLKEARRSAYFAKDVSNTFKKLNTEFAKKFMDLKEEEGGRLIFRLTSNRRESFQKFWELKLVEKITEDHYIFSDLGSTIYNILYLDNELGESQRIKSEEKGKLNELASIILAHWDADSILSLKMSSSGIIDQSNVDNKLLQNLQDTNVLERTIDEELKITNYGKDFIKFLKQQQQLYIEANKLGNVIKK